MMKNNRKADKKVNFFCEEMFYLRKCICYCYGGVHTERATMSESLTVFEYKRESKEQERLPY